ncbi:MAG: hypothetical protein KC656_35140, partial [Myxococcales bacterium]|nr:hypothetical protein [Myxococcales bacterium]
HLAAALDKLDQINPDFKQARIDEFGSQLQKEWMDVNIVIVDHLRDIGHVMIKELQIALETGSDGGGVGATPWCEEGGGALPRLEFKLKDAAVVAMSDGEVLAKGKVTRELPFEWVEKVVAKWILTSVKKKTGG